MDRLSDYVQWMGDFPISATGFRDADAIILCALSYYDLTPVFAIRKNEYRVRDCAELLKGSGPRVMITGSTEGYTELLRLIVQSRRFGDLRMSDYQDIFRADPPLQFSAVCFHDDARFSFLAYRGTDNSLPGWKEDFMISFTKTAAQVLALEYAEKMLEEPREWYIGGHSKGGNLALYAGAMLNRIKWGRVKHLYLLDGPGFCPDVLDVNTIKHIERKTIRIIPKFCVVGKLFEPKIKDTRIVKSHENGVLQHSIISWGIDHGKLALTESNSPESIFINESINQWVSDISFENRVQLVDELFDSLSAGGAETLDDIKDSKHGAIIRSLNSFEETKRMLEDLPKYAARTGIHNFKQYINEEFDTVKHKIEDRFEERRTDWTEKQLIQVERLRKPEKDLKDKKK